MGPALAVVVLCLLPLALPARAAVDIADGYDLYLRGEFARAGEIFRAAAESGDRDAQYMLGGLHALGRGVPPDLRAAHRWLSLAAERGDPLARRLVPVLPDLGPPPEEPPSSAPEPTVARQELPPEDEASAIESAPATARTEEHPPRPADAAAGTGGPAVSPVKPPASGPATAKVVIIAADDALGAAAPAALVGRSAAAESSSPAPPAMTARIQRRLAAIGYDPGAADGVATARTRIAIRAFQSDTGLEIDGQPSAALDAALAAAAGKDGLIAAVQRRLNRLGYPAGPADGVMRPATRDALFAYYKASGIAGVLGLGPLARRLQAELADAGTRAATAAAEP